MSKSQAIQVKDKLITVLSKTPPAKNIDTMSKARAFKEVHAKASKYAQSTKSNLTELQSHLSSLLFFHQ